MVDNDEQDIYNGLKRMLAHPECLNEWRENLRQEGDRNAEILQSLMRVLRPRERKQEMKRTLLFVITQFYRGGAETALVSLLKALSPEDYAVDLLVLSQTTQENSLPAGSARMGAGAGRGRGKRRKALLHDEEGVLAGRGRGAPLCCGPDIRRGVQLRRVVPTGICGAKRGGTDEGSLDSYGYHQVKRI